MIFNVSTKACAKECDANSYLLIIMLVHINEILGADNWNLDNSSFRTENEIRLRRTRNVISRDVKREQLQHFHRASFRGRV